MFVLMISWTSFKMDHIEFNTGLAGQILEKPCVSHRGHIISQNVCLEDISDKFENR